MIGFIYAAKAGELIKLGFSKDPESRIRVLSCGNPFPCELLGYWVGTPDDERALHSKYSASRITGEWFSAANDLVAEIEARSETPKKSLMKSKAEIKSHIQRAVERAGSQKALAEALGISQQGVSYLMTDAKNISAEIAVAIDRYTNGEISKAALRPDLFSAASEGQAA